MAKYYHAPDLRQSLLSGHPKPWLARDIAHSIETGVRAQWIDPDVDVTTIVSGDDSAPDWVPVGATTFADFVNGLYWDGTAIVTDPSGMFKSDDIDGDPWDATKIEAGVGYWNTTGEAGASYRGQALTSIGSEFVAVVEANLTPNSDNAGVGLFAYDGTFDNTFNSLNLTPGGVFFHDANNDHLIQENVTNNAGINRIAARFSTSALAFSANGRAVISFSNPTSPTPMSVVTFYTNSLAGSNAIIRSVVTYPNSTLDADLPVLSRAIPANAKIHIDLVQDWAWTEADGIVAIDTLLGADPNTVNGWGATSYDAGNLTADGYSFTNGNAVALIGTARTKMIDMATVTMKFKRLTSEAVDFNTALVAANGNDAVEIDLLVSPPDMNAGSWNGPIENSIAIHSITNTGVGSINVMAFTVTESRLNIAANGSNAVAGVLVDADRPAANPLVAMLIATANTSAITALQSITIYDPLPNTTGLSALSETGVTNTAPHDITLEWGSDWLSGTGSTSSAFDGAFVAACHAIDDEGNPLVLTLTSDASSALRVRSGALEFNQGLAPGTYNFTLRATDPGGLYVEQTFTITVTE